MTVAFIAENLATAADGRYKIKFNGKRSRENPRCRRRRNQDRVGLGRTRRPGTACRRSGKTAAVEFSPGHSRSFARDFRRAAKANRSRRYFFGRLRHGRRSTITRESLCGDLAGREDRYWKRS